MVCDCADSIKQRDKIDKDIYFMIDDFMINNMIEDMVKPG